MPIVLIPKEAPGFPPAEELSALCFSLGLEVEAPAESPALYAVETPSNRLDLFAAEGLMRAIRTFHGTQSPPVYRLGHPRVTIRVTPAAATVRPHIAGAILRDVSLSPAAVASMSAVQDRLRRHFGGGPGVAVAVGFHDLDATREPFVYDAEQLRDVVFVPPGDNRLRDGLEILGGAQPAHEAGPTSPVLRDALGEVLAMPPHICSSESSAVTPSTRNVFIEVTSATDLARAETVLDVLAGIYSEYAAIPHLVEPVTVIAAEGAPPRATPRCWGAHQIGCDVREVNAMIVGRAGPPLTPESMAKLLVRMGLGPCSRLAGPGADAINVYIPPTRPDMMHACDVLEDIAIAYGYDRIQRHRLRPGFEGRTLARHDWADAMRAACAQAGYLEVINFMIARPGNGTCAAGTFPAPVRILNAAPGTALRSSLVPGLLDSLARNRGARLPIQVFEIGYVCWIGAAADALPTSHLHLAAAVISQAERVGGFEAIHGLLDVLWEVLPVRATAYRLRPQQPLPGDAFDAENRWFWGPRAAEAMVAGGEGCESVTLAKLGLVHPDALQSFGLDRPVAVLTLDLGRAIALQGSPCV